MILIKQLISPTLFFYPHRLSDDLKLNSCYYNLQIKESRSSPLRSGEYSVALLKCQSIFCNFEKSVKNQMITVGYMVALGLKKSQLIILFAFMQKAHFFTG